MIKKYTLKLLVLILYIVSAWFLIHFFALVGIVIAIIFPLVWVIFPKATVCLMCEGRKKDKKCFFCGKKIVQKELFPHPSGLKSALLNATVVFLFSIACIELVYLENKLLLSSKSGVLGVNTQNLALYSKGGVQVTSAIDKNLQAKVRLADNNLVISQDITLNLKPTTFIEKFDEYVIGKWDWILSLINRANDQVAK